MSTKKKVAESTEAPHPDGSFVDNVPRGRKVKYVLVATIDTEYLVDADYLLEELRGYADVKIERASIEE